jgi:N-acetylglutamate synthase-like GNAT family acetyltransferase
MPAGISFRPAAQKDARAIRNLTYRVGNNPMGLRWQRFLVAVNDSDELVGCGQIKQHRDGSHELASVAVLPEWQGRGIGRAIIMRLLEDAPLPLYLTCKGTMEKYYWQHGFSAVTPKEMTPYFIRLWKFFWLIKKFLPGLPPLVVMRKI